VEVAQRPLTSFFSFETSAIKCELNSTNRKKLLISFTNEQLLSKHDAEMVARRWPGRGVLVDTTNLALTMAFTKVYWKAKLKLCKYLSISILHVPLHLLI